MKTKVLFFILFAATVHGTTACDDGEGSSDADTDTGTDTDTDIDGDTDTETEALHGTAPTEPLEAPVFTAWNSDGAERGQADLIGHPIVLWFYPAAATSG